jgi:predicted Fe-Mo cluster-binding NifX family protein
MRIAIPVWNGYISPVLDTARRLNIYDITDRFPSLREEIEIRAGESDLAGFIAARADAIICGAISRQLEQQLLALGVRLHPWVMGETGRLIECYAEGNIRDREFSMPGCRGKGGGGCGRRRRCGASHSIQGEKQITNGEEP